MTEASITILDHVHESNPPAKKKRSLPGTPDPEAEEVVLSPKTLMATNRFLCEICGKGFQRDQNLQLHRRGHNLPWKLKQRDSKEVRKRVYVCPEKTCVHHHPSRALGDLTGIKKHFSRKHGEKKWKCDKCSKRYAVQSDWKAHSKTCGTREYKCDCGTIFSRRDSFITHRAFCDALAQETARVTAATHMNNIHYHFLGASLTMGQHFPSLFKTTNDQNIPIIAMERPVSVPVSVPVSFPHPTTPKNHLQELQPSMGLPNHISHDHYPLLRNPPPPTNHHLNWDFGYKFTPNEMDVRVPSLFSHQNQMSSYHDHQSDNSARMSATALLQKAAQMGATTSTTTTHDPSLIQGNMIMSSSSFVLKSSDNNSVQEDHGNKLLCGLYSTSSATSGIGSDVESSVNDHSALNHLQLYSSKRRRLHSEEISDINGETRDFLGVGVNPICHPSSINGWI